VFVAICWLCPVWPGGRPVKVLVIVMHPAIPNDAQMPARSVRRIAAEFMEMLR
jgi:hypothetical protein